jgi:hypothetical protein
MKRKVLLATTCRWFSAARLTMAFSELGCAVEIVGPMGHPAAKTRALGHRYPFRGLAAAASFRKAIEQAKPELVLPCDDLAMLQLHALARKLVGEGEASAGMLSLLERSLGPVASFPAIEARSALAALASEEGVDGPETAVVGTLEELKVWLGRVGFPAVLKADGSAGGRGVEIVFTMDEAEAGFRRLKTPPGLARAVKRSLFDQDRTLVGPSLRRSVPVVNAQVFLRGRDATMSVACWEGELIASLRVDVIKTQSVRGPASVVRLMGPAEFPEMTRAAEKIARRLKLSGLYGFDFVLDEESGHAHLIEMNARTTQTCHLALGKGRNLAAALYGKIAGEALPETKSVTDGDIIALFPQDWQSDPASAYLTTAYHDVPWTEPKLVKECVDFATSQDGVLKRLVKLYRRMFDPAALPKTESKAQDGVGGLKRDVRG